MIALDLGGRPILITGALGAIADAMIRRLREAGGAPILTDLYPEEEGRRICDERGFADCAYRRMDVTDGGEVERAVAEITEEYPGLGIALGHAGGCGIHPFAETTAEEFERIFRLNYFGQVNLARAVLGQWTKRGTKGHLIFTSSLVGSLPWRDFSAYNSAKAALEMTAKCLALEYAGRGVRVNVVAPGHVSTGASIKIYETEPAYRAMVDRVIPMGRMVRPEAVADAFLWLCSPLAGDVNGQVIKVDLGESIPSIG